MLPPLHFDISYEGIENVRHLFLTVKESKIEKIFVASLLALCYTCDLAGGVFRTCVMPFTLISTHALSHAPTLGSFELPFKMENSQALADPDASFW